MEALDREDHDPKIIYANIKSMEVPILTKDEILDHIELVTLGCIQTFNVSNTFSSWKNNVNGLNNIKHIETDFYAGVNLWINITMDCIIGCSNDDILHLMAIDYPWINTLLFIKNDITKNIKRLNEY